jgi:hypothetical protein
MSNIKIYNPKTFEAGYKLYVEQRHALMKIRNWVVTLNEFWTLKVFDTMWARHSVRYGKDWVIQTINEVIDDDFYTEYQRVILNAIRDEYKYNVKQTN